MYRILGFVGPSGCGKDTAAFHMGKRRGYHYVTLCTTRPKRNEADNGYHFFKYMREKHNDFDCYYVIDKKCNDYNKVKYLGIK